MKKKNIHIVPPHFLNPTNPISINLIGAGGTGSQLLTALARMDFALREMNHCGLKIRLFDFDRVEKANLGRQLFSMNELGLNKAVALINRVNRFFGTNWKALPESFEDAVLNQPDLSLANITITCVDTVRARKSVAEILYREKQDLSRRDGCIYWLDLGNGRDSGQVWLSTVGRIAQPESKKFKVIGELADLLSTHPSLLAKEMDNSEPSCSLAQALNKQDLFINSVLSQMGASLLWSMLRLGVLESRGFFLNLANFRSTPIPI